MVSLILLIALTGALVVGGVVALREYLRPAAELPCELDMTSTVGGYDLDSTFRLRDVTPFDWRTVHVFQEYDSSADVRDQTGHPYVGDRWGEVVPKCTTLFVFILEDEGTCETSLDRSEGRNLVAEAAFDPQDPSFVVRKEGHDDGSPAAGPPSGSRPGGGCG